MTQTPLEICLCTMDFVGPIRNGGIGTAYYALACALRDAGHRVTVLYAIGQWCERGSISQWVDHYLEKNIRFVPVPDRGEAVVSASPSVKASFECYHWLADQERAGQRFDIVHFHEWRGVGFYSTLAKQQGLALQNTVLCVGTHSPELWHRWGMGEFVTTIEDLQIEHIERSALELADVVISPSQYMLDWIHDRQWKLPAATLVRQNILASHLPQNLLDHPSPHAVTELVFFGRLETRKGLVLFCDALDQINRQIAELHELNGSASPADVAIKHLSVTFLGKRTHVDAIESGQYLSARATSWRFPWRVISDLDHAEAAAFLKGPGRLAIIPSLMENSPYTLLECIGNGISCICSDLPGNRELIAQDDADRVCFNPRPAALAKMIRETLKEGATAPRPSISPEKTRADWIAWHEEVAGQFNRPAISQEKPLVSVCMAHRNRHKLLAQAVESVRQQDYPNIELVLVDDGSTDENAVAYLDSLEPDFSRRGWKIVRQANKYLGAARNTAAASANGTWLLFMDDDNVAMPHEISTLVKAALASKSDILTCVMANFRGDEAPTQDTHHYLWLPLGGALGVGIFVNLYGDANALVSRKVFDSIGGFTEDFGIGHEDWEFYSKASLAGYKLQVVPETLFWYRVGAASMLRTTSLFINHMRNLRPYEASLRPELRTVLQFAQAMFLHRNDAVMSAPPPPAPRAAAIATIAVPTTVDDASGPQRLVDEYWNSLSWRISGIVRKTICRVCGMNPPQKPIVSSQREAFMAIEQIRRSISWEATGPLRAMGRTYYAIKPKSLGSAHTNGRPGSNGNGA